MRIIIDQGGITPESDVGHGYTRIKALSFAPQTGVLGQSAPINEVIAEIAAKDDIEPGDYMRLRDDIEGLWAQYWLTSARRIDGQTVRVVGKSDLMLLDRPHMPAKFYSAASVADMVAEVFDAIGYDRAESYCTVDPTIAAATLTGFCPEQTARERLQWICFASGAYIRTYFGTGVQILPIPDAAGTPVHIPLDSVFYKPRITESDRVTAVSARSYSFTQAEPQAGDKYVTDAGGVTYVYTTQDITLDNPDLQPAQYPENAVKAQDVMLMDTARASAAATALARYYFAQVVVEADVIDNGEYMPGMLVSLPVSDTKMVTGYITAADFRFGVQARATLTVVGTQTTTAATLTIRYMYGAELLDIRQYYFAMGYAYHIATEYVDILRDSVRRIFRPLTDYIDGIMDGMDDKTATVQYAIALRLKDGVLDVISVDGVSTVTEDEISIGEID